MPRRRDRVRGGPVTCRTVNAVAGSRAPTAGAPTPGIAASAHPRAKELARLPDYRPVQGGCEPPRDRRDAVRWFKEEWFMASFSIVNNIASVNAQANLSASSLGLNK